MIAAMYGCAGVLRLRDERGETPPVRHPWLELDTYINDDRSVLRIIGRRLLRQPHVPSLRDGQIGRRPLHLHVRQGMSDYQWKNTS